jgi:hypothetical protein|tara:strand:- start:551 stop:712 length:162 start_codon:yes stop_codon:yes gene_type:complete
MVKKKEKPPKVVYVNSYPTAGRPLDKEEWAFVQKNIKKFTEAAEKGKKNNDKK